MITIIHGEDTASSRNYLAEYRQRVTNLVTFDAATVTLTDLAQVLEGGGLFSTDKSVLIEQLFTKKKKSDELDAIVSYLTKQSDADIVSWEGKELLPSLLKKFPKATVHSYKLPSSLFQFVDSLTPGNTTQSLQLFHTTLTTADPEMIFAMLIRQFRLLLAVAESTADIDEMKRLAPWQQQKLTKQAKTFSTKQLRLLYTQLAEIDLSQKTGAAAQSLTATIDIFLLDL
jgi:DNA polymerase III delta subunit